MADNTTVVVVLKRDKVIKGETHEGECPIWIRIIKGRIIKYRSLGISCFDKDWDKKTNLPKKSHPLKEYHETIIARAIREHKEKIMDFKVDGKEFTPAVLIDALGLKVTNATLFKYIESKIADLNESNRIGNADVYTNTLNQLKTFLRRNDITFSQIDLVFLNKFETFFRKRSSMDNTMSVHFRTLRAVFNSAIAEGYAKKDSYPFDKYKISERFSTKTKKRAITKEEVHKVGNLVIINDDSSLEAQKYFMFSYYGQGINFVDIANLQWHNLSNGRIFYKRAKTGQELSFALPQPALDIIEKLNKSTDRNRNTYIFPILNRDVHISATQIKNRIKKVMGRVNKDLKWIGTRVGITLPLTTYVARHSFATALKRSGVSTAVISESMGHQTEAVTQTYLKSFENSIIDEAMKHLL